MQVLYLPKPHAEAYDQVATALSERFVLQWATSFDDAASLLNLQRSNQAYDFDALVIALEVGNRLADLQMLCRACPAVPVIVFTIEKPLSALRAKVLMAGADDCLPVRHVLAEEIHATVYRRVLARYKRPSKDIQIGNLVIDLTMRAARCENRSCTFRQSEWNILELLAVRSPEAVRSETLELLIGPDGEAHQSNMVAVVVGWLRKKLRMLDANVLIANQFGYGYRLELR